MKVHIVHLDPHDDYVSTRDKLGWVKSPRVLIVWPRYGRVLNRKLDLVLLQRFATQHSLQIGIVARDADVLENAEALAIPTFKSIDDVSDSDWRSRSGRLQNASRQRPQRKGFSASKIVKPTPPHRRIATGQSKILRSLLLAIALFSLGGLFFLLTSRAELIISPPIEAQSIVTTIHIDPSLEVPGSDGSIPGQIISARVTDELRLPTSGEIAVPATPATGFVTFTNVTPQSIEIPAGTGLRSSGYLDQHFVTLESVSLPEEIGSQVEAAVEATTLGPSGNLPSGSIDAVEGTLGLKLEVNNIVYLSGGENEVRGAVAEDDLERLEELLMEKLADQALQQLSALLQEDQVILGDTLRSTHLNERVFDREPGEPADTLSLTLDVEFGAFTYRESDLNTTMESILTEQLPVGYTPVPSSFNYKILPDSLTAQSDFVDLDARVWQDIYMPADLRQLRQILRWQEPAHALALVSQYIPLTEAPALLLHPAWLPRIPFLPTRIIIQYSWQVNS